MKYIFHLLLILLLALIIAWGYEIYVVRDGNVEWNDVYEESIQKLWWRETVLAWDIDFKESWFLKNIFWKERNDASKDYIENELLEVYSYWIIDEKLWFPNLSLAWANRYHIIEYCTPGIQLCKDSMNQNMRQIIQSNFKGSSYEYQPYVINFWWIDERVWAWRDCVPVSQKDEYLQAVYETDPLTQDTLSLLGKKLRLPDFDSCEKATNIRYSLRNQMSQAKSVFWLTALPTYIIIDTDEWKWISIPWLYEEKSISQLIENQFPLAK